ncbi:MAG: methyltransferase [Rhodobacteraceae bacterium]|nr:methyltransferase [Paracoccaceae bacterium]
MDDILVTTTDHFLGRKLKICQPERGYRAGVDPVLLAAAVPAEANESVLELGCGVGVASLCLKSRISEVAVTGLEILPKLVQLARLNAVSNALDFNVVEGNIVNLPRDLLEKSFDHVMANPPYFRRDSGIPGKNWMKEFARVEITPLRIWTETASRRVKPKGYVHFILRTERLPELLDSLPHYMGSVEVTPLVPREGCMSGLMLLKARKSGRASFKLKPQIVMHQHGSHGSGTDGYTQHISSVLRDGSALI